MEKTKEEENVEERKEKKEEEWQGEKLQLLKRDWRRGERSRR